MRWAGDMTREREREQEQEEQEQRVRPRYKIDLFSVFRSAQPPKAIDTIYQPGNTFHATLIIYDKTSTAQHAD